MERKTNSLRLIVENIGRSSCFEPIGLNKPTFDERLASAKQLDAQIAATAEQEINDVIESFTPNQETNP